MSKETRIFSLVFIAILLILSYRYVVDEADAAYAADPTHDGKELLAILMPYIWITLIIICLGVAFFVAVEDIG